jgi:large subunit ribosomal protein L3
MVDSIFGRKIGMTQFFDEIGNVSAVSVIEVGPCTVLEWCKHKKDRAVTIGYLEVKKEKKKKKPQLEYFKKIKQPYFKHLKEVNLTTENVPEPGTSLGVGIFEENQKVDISALSIGKGFQGGMKRHNWKGQSKSHGSTTHRRIGSVGASADPSRIVKGLNMPGHMGNKKVTVRNLKIVKIDKQKGLLFLNGSCPGAKNSLVFIKRIKS